MSLYRSNPLYDEDESYFPGTSSQEPTSSVFAIPSMYSVDSMHHSTMTNSNSANSEELQVDKQILINEEPKSNLSHAAKTIIKSNSNHSSSSGYSSTKHRPPITTCKFKSAFWITLLNGLINYT